MQMLGGCWFIEQPASSRLIWYPRFEWLSHSAWSTTWQIGWWARHFKALTPKRHRAWSNSMEIGVLNRGVLTKKQRDSCPVKTTDRRVKLDATGKSKTTWSGNKNLKKTQPRPQLACKLQPLVSTCRATFMSCNLPRSYPIPFGLHMQRYMQVLRSSGCGNLFWRSRQSRRRTCSARWLGAHGQRPGMQDINYAGSFCAHELWQAGLEEAIVYMRGSMSLKASPRWKKTFPLYI